MDEHLHVCFKCTYNDAGYKSVCSDEIYAVNIREGRRWCEKAPCRSFNGLPTKDNHPCYESIIFSEWRFGAGWDHKTVERPRKMNHTGLGKIAFLTTVKPGNEEEKRSIIGLFQISDMLGGEKQETVVIGAGEHKLIVPDGLQLHFWDFYRNPKAPERKVWGTGLFRYLDDTIARGILSRIEAYCSKNESPDVYTKIIHELLGSLSHRTKPSIHSSEQIPQGSKAICLNCGASVRTSAKFCTFCGVVIRWCRRCNAVNLSSDRYCAECGFTMLEVNEVAQNNSDTLVGRELTLRDALLRYGELHKKTLEDLKFTNDDASNAFVKQNPVAFLFGVIFDQGINAERAWTTPYILKDRLGHFDLSELAKLDETRIRDVFGKSPKLHRFWMTMGKRIVAASRMIIDKYGGDAEAIWNDCPRSEELERRFRQFDGIGQKKASMAVNILARDFGIKVQNTDGIDVSYDEMVRRVFARSGLVRKDTLEEVISVARRLNPEYPGALDHPAWLIGRTFCHKTNPSCSSCPLDKLCIKQIFA